MGVLHHLGIETALGNPAESRRHREQLVQRGVDNVVHPRKPLLAQSFAEPFQDVREFKHEDIDMVVLHRHVSPSASLQAEVAEHLSLGKRHVPHVVPRQSEVDGLLAQGHILPLLLTLRHLGKVVSSSDCADCSLLVFAIGIEGGREIIAFRDDILVEIVYRSLCCFQVFFIPKVSVSHHQRRGSRRSAPAGGVDIGAVVVELASKTAVALLERHKVVEQHADAFLPFLMLSSMLLLILQVEQYGIHGLRLLAD